MAQRNYGTLDKRDVEKLCLVHLPQITFLTKQRQGQIHTTQIVMAVLVTELDNAYAACGGSETGMLA